jgi:hypothetical protein
LILPSGLITDANEKYQAFAGLVSVESWKFRFWKYFTELTYPSTMNAAYAFNETAAKPDTPIHSHH